MWKSYLTFLAALKFVPDWFVTDIFSNDDIDFNDIDPDIVTLFSDDVGFVNIDLSNNINLDGVGDPANVVLARFIAWRNRIKQHKACEKK